VRAAALHARAQQQQRRRGAHAVWLRCAGNSLQVTLTAATPTPFSTGKTKHELQRKTKHELQRTSS
jgi:hypothetical protein